ncbi:MAG: hypothetical protein FWD68_18760 [Alphaproteobacteria bacterium]|nr:hypothetical protein [Alphaproteobacteria bacterium]
MYTDAELDSLCSTYTSGSVPRSLKAEITAQVTSWRWASASMTSWIAYTRIPFMPQLHGGPAPRWVDDNQADPRTHVHHGLDAEGRIIIECDTFFDKVCLYAPQRRLTVLIRA